MLYPLSYQGRRSRRREYHPIRLTAEPKLHGGLRRATAPGVAAGCRSLQGYCSDAAYIRMDCYSQISLLRGFAAL